MKKTLWKLLVLALLCCLPLCLAACGGEKGGDNNADENGVVFKSKEEIASSFTNGKFTLKLSTAGSNDQFLTVVQCDEGYYYASYEAPLTAPDDATLLIKEGNGFKYYTVADGKRTFVMDYQSDDTAEAYVGNIFNVYFTAYAGLSGSDFEKKGSSTVAGRDCTKYSYSYNGLGVSVSYEYNIDNATGICMKYVGAAYSGGEGGGYSWEIIDFSLGNASLTAYTSLPLTNEGGGIHTGDTATWPSAKIALLADYVTETTVPTFSGASSFNYLVSEGTAVITANEVTETELSAYRTLLVNNGYAALDGYYAGSYQKVLQYGDTVRIGLIFDADAQSLVISVVPTPSCEADSLVPEKVKLSVKVNDTTFTTIKIGNDYYRTYIDVDTYETYAKYDSNGKKWSVYERINSGNWEYKNDMESVTNINADFLAEVTDSYIDGEVYTKSGNEKIAGVDCVKYSMTDEYGDTTNYWKSYSNLVLKKTTVTSGTTAVDWEVTLYDTTVTAFGVSVP